MQKLLQQQKDLQAQLDRINSMLDSTQTELESWQGFIRYQQLKKLK